MKPESHLLVVDDDQQICSLLRGFLSKYGYRVSTASNGHEMQRVLKDKNIDLIILDIMMSGDDGLTLCRQLRKVSAVPIIILSAIGTDTDRIVGLEVGADDYLAKPFNPRELLARIKALLRRVDGIVTEKIRSKAALKALPKIHFCNWVLDCNKRHLIAPDGLTVPLSSGEYELLLAFVEHPGRTLSREQLLDLTSGRESTPFDRSIDVQVGRLRKKIEKDLKNPKIIITVRGGGYQFTAKVTAETA